MKNGTQDNLTYKHTLTLDKFREAIKHQVEILKERDYNYKLAADFGLVKETGNDVVFWFEKNNMDTFLEVNDLLKFMQMIKIYNLI